MKFEGGSRLYPAHKKMMQTAPVSLPTERLKFGNVVVDVTHFAGAIDAVEALVERGQGGFVVTPNIDHVVIAETSAPFQEAYRDAALSIADGMPLVWASRFLGRTLPERISGSDIMGPLFERAAKKKWRLYFLGAGPGVAEEAARRVTAQYGAQVVGVDSPKISIDPDAAENKPVLERIRAAKPDLLFVALGAPKQEIWMHRFSKAYAPAVALGIGAGLDFVAGAVQRAPAWMQKSGLEWAYRLSREPKRLWRRYLVNDPKFLAVLARTMRLPLAERVTRR